LYDVETVHMKFFKSYLVCKLCSRKSRTISNSTET